MPCTLDGQTGLHCSTPTHDINVVSSSEAASLKGHKAKTPIIAGSVCGGLMLIAYIIGFTIYIKRRRRKQRNAKEGVDAATRPKQGKAETVIIPPDPAIVLGLRQPGENAFGDNHKSNTPTQTPHHDVASSKKSTGRSSGHLPAPALAATQQSTP